MPRARIRPNGPKVFARRVRCSLTQAQLAKLAGYDKRTIERIEKSEPTTTETLVNVAQVLGCCVATLAQFELLDTSRDVASRVQFWRALEQWRRVVDKKAEEATLSLLQAANSDAECLEFVCKTESKTWTFLLKSDVTLAELSH